MSSSRIPPLSPSQTAVLVGLSLTSASALGLKVTYDGGAALSLTDNDAVLGLTNLARAAAARDSIRWPSLVREHFAEMARQLQQGAPTPPADPATELIQRLVPRASLPSAWTADRADFLPGLVSVPATINDGVVKMYFDPTDLNLTWSAAEGFGLANLRQHLVDVEHMDYEGVPIELVTGTSFAASKALVLETVLRESLHVETPPYGVLAALPTRDLLMIHVIKDRSAVVALGHLLHLATRTHLTGQGPLTPTVYWVSPEQEWYPAIATSPDGPAPRLLPRFQALTNELGGDR